MESLNDPSFAMGLLSKKKFWIIPINDNMHWSLAILCNPSAWLTDEELMESIRKGSLEVKKAGPGSKEVSKESAAGNVDPSSSSGQQAKMEIACCLHLDSLRMHRSARVFQGIRRLCYTLLEVVAKRKGRRSSENARQEMMHPSLGSLSYKTSDIYHVYFTGPTLGLSLSYNAHWIFVSQINEPEETTKNDQISREEISQHDVLLETNGVPVGEDYHTFLVRLQKQVRSENGGSMKLLRRKMKTITFHGPKVGLK